MQSNSEILSSYQVSLTRAELFDSSENTGYTTYGILVQDSQGEVLYQEKDFHTNRKRVEVFIGRLFDPEHLFELVEGYLDGCDDLHRRDKRDKAEEYSCV